MIAGSPAYRSSLRVGDVILAVDGFETDRMTADCIIKHVTGAVGNRVTLTVGKAGAKAILDVVIERSSISLPSVEGLMKEPKGWKYMVDERAGIGYIRVSSFIEDTAGDFAGVLRRLEGMAMRGLVIDLRDNPGGLVTAASEVVDNFIEKGMIVSVRPRFGMAGYLSAHDNDVIRDYPIAILVNKYTASAAEIVAGAMQDQKHKRAVIVGERTFGKASVQNIRQIEGQKAKLKFTTAYYHLPSGTKIDKNFDNSSGGIRPDIEVVMTPAEKERAIQFRKNNEAGGAGGLRLEDDVQLYVSVEVLRCQLSIADSKAQSW